MTMNASGSCLCGAIRYEVTGPLRPVIGCHCVQCRKTSGHHVAATSAPRAAVRIIGEPAWYSSSPTARRGFCPTCGSSLFWDPAAGGHMAIHAGTLDGDAGVRMAGHVFVADMGAYYTLEDGLPQADGDHPHLATQVIDT